MKENYSANIMIILGFTIGKIYDLHRGFPYKATKL